MSGHITSDDLEATILPLKGNYYGTELSIALSDGRQFTIEIWLNGEPSSREKYKDPYDNHYESQDSYEVASAIASAINQWGDGR